MENQSKPSSLDAALERKKARHRNRQTPTHSDAIMEGVEEQVVAHAAQQATQQTAEEGVKQVAKEKRRTVSQAILERGGTLPAGSVVTSESLVQEAVEMATKKGAKEVTKEVAKEVAKEGVEQVAKHSLGKMVAGGATLAGVGLMLHNMSSKKGQQSNQELYGQKRSYM